MATEPRITLTLTQARTVQEILRYTTTSNPWVINATVTMYQQIEDQISRPKTCNGCCN